jgi:hypothetical protein
MHGNSESAGPQAGPGPGCTTTAAAVLNPSRALVVLPVPLPGGRLVQLGPAITQCHTLGFQVVSYDHSTPYYRTPGKPTHDTRQRLLVSGPGPTGPAGAELDLGRPSETRRLLKLDRDRLQRPGPGPSSRRARVYKFFRQPACGSKLDESPHF